jgi:hypothetical protein
LKKTITMKIAVCLSLVASVAAFSQVSEWCWLFVLLISRERWNETELKQSCEKDLMEMGIDEFHFAIFSSFFANSWLLMLLGHSYNVRSNSDLSLDSWLVARGLPPRRSRQGRRRRWCSIPSGCC